MPSPTLGEHIIDSQKNTEHSTGELSRLLSAIKLASKVISKYVNMAGLQADDILGETSTINVQGEDQKKLDVVADKVFMQALINRRVVAGIGSEEQDDFIAIEGAENNKYIILLDPLDGSSNIDVNVSVGTIFSIYKRVSPVGNAVVLEDFLQPGVDQVAAGYVLYGSSTMLVYTTGQGVNGFTLDPSIGSFYLSHPQMKLPEKGKIYSINQANYSQFPAWTKAYLKKCEADEQAGYSARYIGSLVADFHRNLLKGGVYLYPETNSQPNGKLRLLYECNPIAMIAEQAGGGAFAGTERVLTISPTALHQRTPFVVGSKEMVDNVLDLMDEESK